MTGDLQPRPFAIPPPPVQLLGIAVLLQGPILREALGLIALGLRAHRGDGLRASPRVEELMAALRTSLRAQQDIADMTEAPSGATWIKTQEIDSEEAAVLLGVTARQVRRIATDLDGRRTKSGWRFDRGVVLSYAIEREQGRGLDRR